MWEAPVERKRTSVGLDVHARSVMGCGLDGATGELFERRLTPDHGELLGWLRVLPAPVAVTYEAARPDSVWPGSWPGRASTAGWQRRRSCSVRRGIASRPTAATPGIWPGCYISGRSSRSGVPGVGQEAARDLVRAREDLRRDLLSARHRLSKLLLRQGIVYYGGKPWTANHDRRLRARRGLAVFDQPGLGLAFR
jgi:hypothetical protein